MHKKKKLRSIVDDGGHLLKLEPSINFWVFFFSLLILSRKTKTYSKILFFFKPKSPVTNCECDEKSSKSILSIKKVFSLCIQYTYWFELLQFLIVGNNCYFLAKSNYLKSIWMESHAMHKLKQKKKLEFLESNEMQFVHFCFPVITVDLIKISSKWDLGE